MRSDPMDHGGSDHGVDAMRGDIAGDREQPGSSFAWSITCTVLDHRWHSR